MAPLPLDDARWMEAQASPTSPSTMGEVDQRGARWWRSRSRAGASCRRSGGEGRGESGASFVAALVEKTAGELEKAVVGQRHGGEERRQ